MEGHQIKGSLQRVVRILHSDGQGIGPVVPRGERFATRSQAIALVVDDDVAVADPGHEVDAAGEEAPDLRSDHRVAKSNVVAGEGVVSGQLGGEDIGHCVHGDRAHRDIAAAQREIEGQFVQSVPPIEVAEAAALGA